MYPSSPLSPPPPSLFSLSRGERRFRKLLSGTSRAPGQQSLPRLPPRARVLAYGGREEGKGATGRTSVRPYTCTRNMGRSRPGGKEKARPNKTSCLGGRRRGGEGRGEGLGDSERGNSDRGNEGRKKDIGGGRRRRHRVLQVPMPGDHARWRDRTEVGILHRCVTGPGSSYSVPTPRGPLLNHPSPGLVSVYQLYVRTCSISEGEARKETKSEERGSGVGGG